MPATAANLGPGFDCLALALDVWNEFEVDTDAPAGIHVEGEGAKELRDPERNLVHGTIRDAFVVAGREPPSYGLACRNRIPLERGLGSSASAVVGGLLLARALMGEDPSAGDVLDDAARIEGHPDNVAAALSGGVVVVYADVVHGGALAGTEGSWRTAPLPAHPGLRPVLLVPEHERLSTVEARRVLPANVPLADAVFNASRAALAVVALTARPDLLREAMQDRLHQEARLRLVPEAGRVFHDMRAAGVPVCVAGSGPSLLAFESDERPVPDPGSGWSAVRAGVAARGATVDVT